MICDIDIFTYPENLDDARMTIQLLHSQMEFVEGLERMKVRLAKTRRLNSYALTKCEDFVHYVNQSPPSGKFYLEVSALNLNEMAFMAICFTEKRLDALVDSFKASNVRNYVKSQKISCQKRPEIVMRLKTLASRFKNSNFAHLYEAVAEKRKLIKSSEPTTCANDQHDKFELLGASWENIERTFGQHFANNFRGALELPAWGLVRIKSRYPRDRSGGDATITLDLGSSMRWVSSLFRRDGRGAEVSEIPKILGARIADALDKSELRQWEKAQGLLSTTNCIQLSHHLELRVCYDTNIAASLHSDIQPQGNSPEI